VKLSRRRADGPTISAGRVARSMSSRQQPSRRRLTPRRRMPAPNPPSSPSTSRRWMLTPLKRAGSRSRPSAGRGLVSITMRGLTSARTSRPSGRVAGESIVSQAVLQNKPPPSGWSAAFPAPRSRRSRRPWRLGHRPSAATLSSKFLNPNRGLKKTPAQGTRSASNGA
jgi:hypothetical protein